MSVLLTLFDGCARVFPWLLDSTASFVTDTDHLNLVLKLNDYVGIRVRDVSGKQ